MVKGAIKSILGRANRHIDYTEVCFKCFKALIVTAWLKLTAGNQPFSMIKIEIVA